MEFKRIRSVALIVLLFGVASCTADYDERIDYLREVGLRGVEVNNLLRAQGTEVNEDSCRNANDALNDDIPQDTSGGASDRWRKLVEQTFIKACTLGKY